MGKKKDEVMRRPKQEPTPKAEMPRTPKSTRPLGYRPRKKDEEEQERQESSRSQLYGTPRTENPNQPSTVTRVKAGGTAPYTPVDALVESATPKPTVQPKPYEEKNPAPTVKPLSYSPYAGSADQIRQFTGNGKDEEEEKPGIKKPAMPAQPQPTSPYTGFMGEEDEDEGGVEEQPAQDKPQAEDRRKELEKELADIQANEGYIIDPDEASRVAARKKEIREELATLPQPEEEKAPELVNWEGRDELIKELEQIDTDSGMISTPEEAQAAAARRAEIIRELEAGDEAAGNGLQSYGDVDRGRQIVSGAAGQYASGMVNAAGTALDFAGSLGDIGARLGNASPYAGYATDPFSAEVIGTGTDEEKQAWAEEMGRVQEFLQPVQDVGHSVEAVADSLGESAAKDLESAKAGLDGLGSAGVDIATNIIQMGFDAGLGGLGAMFARSAGAAAGEARQAGANIEDQLAYGITKGGIEVATEKLFDGVAGIFGKGAADDIVESVIGKLAKSDTGRTILRVFAGAAGEGGEEVISDLLAPFAEQIYKDGALKDLFANGYNGSEMLYDFLIGAAIGGLGGGTSIATGQNAAKNAELQSKAQAPEVEALVQAATPQAPGIKPGMEIGQESDTGTGGGPSVAEILAQQAQGQAPSTPTIKQAPGMELTPETDTGTGGPIVAPAAEEARESVPVPPTAPEANTELSQEFNSGTDEIAPEAPAAQSAKEAAQSIAASIGLPQSKAAETGLQEIADYIQSNGNGEGVDEETVQNMAREAAENIIAEIPGQETGDKATFDAVKDILGKRGLQISDELRGDVADYNDWRKSLFGKLNLVKDGEAIDSIYSELSTLMPGLFPANITAQADMVNRIVEVLDGTKPQTTTWADTATQADYDAAVEEMTQKVLDAAQNVGSTAEAVSEENLASLAGQEPPVMLGNQPTTPSTVEANGPTVERGFAKNVRTTDSTEEALAKSLGKDKVTYERLLNKDVLARSQELFDRGIDRAKSYLYDAIYNAKNGAKLPPEAVPLARMVANQMAADGDVVGAERLIADVAAELTQAGQLGQVGKILRQGIQTPEGRLYGMQKTVEALNRSADGKYEVELPQDLVEKYNEQTTDEGRDAVITEMQQAIADQIPSTFLDKFTALRYTAMLGNFKTQARNVLGNVGSTVMRMTKDRLASVGEIIYSMFNPDFERTKSIWAGGKLYKEALGDFENVAEETMGEGKYSDNRSMGKEIEDKRTILKINGKWGTNEAKTAAGRSIPAKAARKAADLGMGALEGWRKGTNWAMDYGDRVFNAINYADALGGWLAAHNIKSISDASPEMLNRARKYAIQQAQEATFRDKNQFSDWAAGLGKARNPNNKVEKAAEAVSKGALPFRRTPANIAVRAEEYSPIGLANTIVDAWNAAKGNGDVTASDVIDQAAKTLTGTGLAALGLIMAKSGLFGIKARGKDDDEKQENFDKLRGAQDYSWIMPDGTSVTMDWVTPGSIPFFMGVELADLMDEGGLTFADGWSIIESFTDPMLELSMLSGLNDALNVQSAYSGDGTKPLVLVAENALASLLSQAAPTLMGQIERMGEDYRQSTYYDNDSQIPKVIQKAISKVGAKIPGWDYQQQDYIDAWGRKQENKKGWDAFYENFISPYYTSEDRSTPIDDELQRLYDSGMDKVFPEYAKRNPGGDLGRLSPEEYETYATVKGQTSLALVQDFIESDQYKDLSDNERAEIIGNLYKLANTSAKTAVMRQRDEDYTGVEKGDYATALTDAGMETSDVLDFLFGVAEDGSPTQAELKSYYKEHPDEADYIGALWDASGFTGKDTATWELYLASVKGK